MNDVYILVASNVKDHDSPNTIFTDKNEKAAVTMKLVIAPPLTDVGKAADKAAHPLNMDKEENSLPMTASPIDSNGKK